MKILVTGAAGFIGSHVVDACVAAGHDVVGVDNLVTGLRENVHPEARFYEADIRELDTLTDIFTREQPEIVNHHAAQVNIRVSVERPVYDAEVNVAGTVSVLEAAARCGARKVIFISSGGAVYGDADTLPTPEAALPRPISQYGAAKLAGEAYCHVYRVTRGLTFTILRYANVYGPRQNPEGEAGVTAIFARMMLEGRQPTIFGDGTKTRDYVNVADVAAVNVAVLEAGDLGVFNVGTGIGISDRQVFDAVARAAGYEGEPRLSDFRPGEVMHSTLDCSQAREVLGWRPAVAMAEGVGGVVAYQRQQMAKGR